MGSWRVAPSLNTLLADVNRIAPRRHKGSDGTIGDAAHSSRESDHNPDRRGVVHARDVTHDPRSGLNCYTLSEQLRQRRDPRIRYVIFARRIFYGPGSDGNKRLWVWEPYDGINAHKAHMHVSVGYSRAAENGTARWFGKAAPKPKPKPKPKEDDLPLDAKDKEWLAALVEDGCRRAVHAIMTGGVGQWSNPKRDGWEFYTPEVQRSALVRQDRRDNP